MNNNLEAAECFVTQIDGILAMPLSTSFSFLGDRALRRWWQQVTGEGECRITISLCLEFSRYLSIYFFFFPKIILYFIPAGNFKGRAVSSK